MKEIDLETIIQELYNISGFRITLLDADKKHIYAYPDNLSAFCGLIQSRPDSYKKCCECDAAALEQAEKTGEAYIYQCYLGLYEAVAPLYHFGVLSGFLMMGQSLDDSEGSLHFTLQAALPFIKDKYVLQQAALGIPIRTQSQILSCISIMEICAAYITLSNRLNRSTENLASKISEYVMLNYSSKITIDQLCNYFYCSRATITSTFKRSFRCSVNEYLTQIRLKKSKELLKNSTESILVIADKCGFSDQNYYAKVFRRAFGMTPSQYRGMPLQTSIPSEYSPH